MSSKKISVEAVFAYLNMVGSIKELPCKSKLELFEAKSQYSLGDSALYYLLQDENREAAMAYLDFILSYEDILENDRVEILKAKNIYGKSILHDVFSKKECQNKTIVAYLTRIMTSNNLSAQSKSQILAGIKGQSAWSVTINQSVWSILFRKNNSDTLRIYIDEMLRLSDLNGFDPMDVLKSVAMINKKGENLIYSALSSSTKPLPLSVEIYLQTIIASDKISTEQKLDLINYNLLVLITILHRKGSSKDAVSILNNFLNLVNKAANQCGMNKDKAFNDGMTKMMDSVTQFNVSLSKKNGNIVNDTHRMVVKKINHESLNSNRGVLSNKINANDLNPSPNFTDTLVGRNFQRFSVIHLQHD